MATIVKKAIVHASASAVWRRVTKLENVPALSGRVESCRVEGTTRTYTVCGLGELRETILSVDHELRRVAYRLHDAPPPIVEHAASIVVEGDDAAAVITWTTDLSPDSAREAFADGADALFASMLARITTG